ncbi:MAG: hypothetical protein E7423_10115 [Ruminococcaceae bacterium]|nr:hypothetical protein [Oscillospiraceae bacterium]
MVSGVTKQAVILRPRADSGFEQAIFILSPRRQELKAETPEELVALADAIAREYTVTGVRRVRLHRLWPLLVSFALGAAACALCFFLVFRMYP